MYSKKVTQKNTKFQKKDKYELGLDPPTHFRVCLGFLDWQNPLANANY